MSSKIWSTTLYLRISREDNEQGLSNSLVGQREALRTYLCQHPELQEYAVRIDDGVSGISFERPAFHKMMQDIKEEKTNCIIVNDLSRFGRNYLEVGEYLEKIFPLLGVRFIAVNDYYDSLVQNPSYKDYIIPFKNLLNEAFSRDLSVKIRSQLEAKRRSGAFVGAFPAYGYLKNPKNRHQLMIDERVATVVQDVFRWKIEGFSPSDIALKLNRLEILTPANYKMETGIRYTTPFKMKDKSEWSAGMILRILKNPIYTGVLQQGLGTTPSFKSKKRIVRPMEEWSIVENSHGAIISKIDFTTVQRILAADTRRTPTCDTVFPFSGLVFCGECGSNMVRKTVPAGEKKYVYYICASHKNTGTCVPHNFRDITLDSIVLAALRAHIQMGSALGKKIVAKDDSLLKTAELQKGRQQILKKEVALRRLYYLLSTLQDNLSDKILTQDEFYVLKQSYTSQAKSVEKQIGILRLSITQSMHQKSEMHTWISEFSRRKDFAAIERSVVVTFIDQIFIYANKRVEIVFRWQGECDWLRDELAKEKINDRKNEASV